MSRCGFLVSSAVVATMSNRMKAKKTSAALASIPPMPKSVGSRPNIDSSSGACRPEVPSAGSDGGMNGL